MATVVALQEEKEWKSKIQSAQGSIVVEFFATFAPQCQHLHAVFEQLAKKYGNLQYFSVDAEKLPEISKKYGIEAVPAYLFFQNGKKTTQVVGANVALLTKTIASFSSNAPIAPSATTATAASAPSGSASNDNASNGGVGVDMKTRLEQLINQAPVMIFMKGSPDAPRCGFSARMVEALKTQKVKFSSFDILEDNQVREGLKKYSDWPTFPQLYVKGSLLGGIDIVQDLIQSGQFLSEIPPSEIVKETPPPVKAAPTAAPTAATVTSIPTGSALEQRLKSLITQDRVVLFMKGTPDGPKCGFSRKAVELLRQHIDQFGSFDILSDEEVRQGLKIFSNWPTYPQLYVDGELVGGVDIIQELHTNGELKTMLGR